MRFKWRLPLRWRFTLMTGAVAFVSTLCMMLVSIYYANDGFDVVMTNVDYYYRNTLPSEIETMILMDEINSTDTKNESYRQNINDRDKSTSNKNLGKNVIVIGEPQYFHFSNPQDDLSSIMGNGISDADAASSTVYYPDNSAISKKFARISVMTMFTTTLLGMVIAYVLSYLALEPIRDLNERVLSITGSNLNRRVEESGAHDEVGSLQKSFNGMMDRLEESFKRQKEFSRNVAHELKTPLTTMKTGIQVLHLDEAPTMQDMEQVLKITEKNIDRLISIVQDLLLFTKEEHVEFDTEVDIKALLRQILDEHHDVAEKRSVDCILQCEDNIKIIQNEALLSRALSNLIENAIKYNHVDGQVEIHVVQDADKLRIDIKDTGIGIEKHQLQRIWEPFYCIDESRSRALGGAGIGLALVKSIAEKCQFDVRVESVKGKGSCFTIEMSSKL